ncbi:DUF3267 domain-containing protein [Metabacillus idriensis]|uniref:DUF3267 domain-containing protein n=1 Tax=Metabacillus idriensis TaxID=324768 RepID=UPI0028149632|nr:DUF3267 domain-containing protein [Metabacillus idriensis]MDR0136320.1 DUF3267 domain-containing protein [Metabacillus idriensis]
MNCWKTINLSKDYGFHRLFIVSVLTMMITFISIYLPLVVVFPSIHLKEDHFFLLLLFIICIVPCHKLLHAMPLWMYGYRVSLKLKFQSYMPILFLKTNCNVSKASMTLSLLTPFVIVTAVMIAGLMHFPAYLHYFCLAIAFHTGLCVTDFIFLSQLSKAPKACFIEEADESFEILFQKY